MRIRSMSTGRLLTFSLCVVVCAALASQVRSQETHIALRYEKDIDKTIVTSDVLYVVNMPTHFMQVQLSGRYSKKASPPSELPDWLELEFFSYSLQPRFQKDEAHRLRIKADDEILDLGLMTYSKIDEIYQSKEGEKRISPKVRAALPENALVRATPKSTGLVLEIMSARGFGLAELNKIARASSVIVRIGETVFPLRQSHMSIAREFAAAVTPTNAAIPVTKSAPPALNIPADVPSDSNNMPLPQTMVWLKNSIAHRTSSKGAVVPVDIEPVDVKECRLNYRMVPRVRNPSNSTSLVYEVMEYQINLADLNPETITISRYTDYSRLFMTTRDAQPKIIQLGRENVGAMGGRTLEDHKLAHASIEFENFDAAAQFRVALLHAIQLCRAKP